MTRKYILLIIAGLTAGIMTGQNMAQFFSTNTASSALRVDHMANTSIGNHAIQATAESGRAISALSQTNYGISAWSVSFHGARFNGDNSNGYADIVLNGGDWIGGDDDGVIMSDPDESGSDIFIVSNDAVVIELDHDDGESGHFEVWNGDDREVLIMAEDGQLEIWNGAAANNRRLLLEPDGDLFIDGTITEGSDRNRKEKIIEIDYARILASVQLMPVYEWQYIGQDRRHVGPMAQDFHVAFGLGEDDTGIANIDANGVAFASIKALYEQNLEQQSEIDALKQEMTKLRMLLKAHIVQGVEEEESKTF